MKPALAIASSSGQARNRVSEHCTVHFIDASTNFDDYLTGNYNYSLFFLSIVVAVVDKRLRDVNYYRNLSETRYQSLYESMRDATILFDLNHFADYNKTTL